jgi:hypothetical protein
MGSAQQAGESVPYLDAATVERLLPIPDAIAVLKDAWQ